jgi:hypothetical protein
LKSDINGTPYYAVTALIAKITKMMVSLPRDTMAKACRSYGGKWGCVGGWQRFFMDFLNQMVPYIPGNIACKFGIHTLKINWFKAFLLKK